MSGVTRRLTSVEESGVEEMKHEVVITGILSMYLFLPRTKPGYWVLETFTRALFTLIM